MTLIIPINWKRHIQTRTNNICKIVQAHHFDSKSGHSLMFLNGLTHEADDDDDDDDEDDDLKAILGIVLSGLIFVS